VGGVIELSRTGPITDQTAIIPTSKKSDSNAGKPTTTQENPFNFSDENAALRLLHACGIQGLWTQASG
jgi:hypothetical protein